MMFMDSLVKLNLFLIIFATLIITATFFFFNSLYFLSPKMKNFFYKSLKKFIILSIFISLCFLIFIFLSYYLNLTSQKNIFINKYNFFFYKTVNFCIYNFFFNLGVFDYVILILAYLVGFFSLLSLDSRFNTMNLRFYVYFNYFILIVFIFVSTTNIWLFFFFYELLLVPSFLFVYFTSYTRKAIQASMYFVVWTQFGSLLVLIAVSYMYIVSSQSEFFLIKLYNFDIWEQQMIYFLLFLGFGLKIPIWPCHYWLTKTHVEAPTGFSIYLSGFLVKSALLGFFKLSNLLNVELTFVFYSVIAFLGSIDASLKMWGQHDLKKLVAYCTVQEMSLLLLLLLWGDSSNMICCVVFSVAHAFLSTVMFYLVDCIYRRFNTRSIFEVQGILHVYPNLGVLIILMVFFYAGLPGTVKFSCEFLIFSTLLEKSWISCFILMFSLNVIGIIGFSKSWFNAVFGLPTMKKDSIFNVDLTYKEIYIILFCFFVLTFLTYFLFFVF